MYFWDGHIPKKDGLALGNPWTEPRTGPEISFPPFFQPQWEKWDENPLDGISLPHFSLPLFARAGERERLPRKGFPSPLLLTTGFHSWE